MARALHLARVLLVWVARFCALPESCVVPAPTMNLLRSHPLP